MTERFLLLCLRGRWDPSAIEEARTLAARGGVDWDALLCAARTGGVSPLLYAVARDRGLLPGPLRGALRLDCYATAACNLRLFCQLERVLCGLEANGVPVILLKGAALAEAVYGNASLRPMSDLDLLVREGDAPAALRVLSTLGYQCPHGEFRPGYILAHRNQMALATAGADEGPIEVHWRLISPPYYQRAIHMDWFWQTAWPVRIGDAPALILGPEAQVLHLCGHMLQHGGAGRARLLWLHDLAEVLVRHGDGGSGHPIDWEQVLARAQACGLLLAVGHALERVRDEWRVPLPRAVLQGLRALRPSRDERRVYALLTAAPRRVRLAWAGLESTPDWGQRVRYLWANLFPSAHYMRRNYRIPHRLLTPLYYPYRWLRSLRRVVR